MASLIPRKKPFLRWTTTTTNTIRSMSQSTSLPRTVARVRDHGFDGLMDAHKKLRRVCKLRDLILLSSSTDNNPSRSIPVPRLENLARRYLGMKQFESCGTLLNFPHVFEVFEHPIQRVLWCRLSLPALRQIDQESLAVHSMLPDTILRLRKLLMLSNTRRLPLGHIRLARADLGLPDDFEYSVILKNPGFFRLFDEGDEKFVEVVDTGDRLGLVVCAIERRRELEYRSRGKDAEDVRFSFVVNFPPGFKIGKYLRIAVWKWQRLPYWSPYEDVSGHDLRSFEAMRRMEKRAVAMVHEILSLTVEKKMTLERIAKFRLAMDLPKKLKEFLLQHQGIFYVSTRGNMGKIHTVFLREAYRRGELLEANDIYLARRRLFDLVMMRPKSGGVDMRGELSGFRREEECFGRECVERMGPGLGTYVNDSVVVCDDEDDSTDDGQRNSRDCVSRADLK
ncbi:hypothetical protein QJS10_CPA10g00661 [Acorus calamus]|uniref:PORR domain-containing protein n=1 Tax=Acorus calamus TaxID=4465 RepID=A0AAV9DYU8_ACOCL|nr:hypothetical protein QJS10_CPA10g00661 [Acorus calamus]